MGEYEPNDSRKVTQTQDRAPGEPPRTGPREAETRPKPDEARQPQGELTEDQRGDEPEATVDPQQPGERRR